MRTTNAGGTVDIDDRMAEFSGEPAVPGPETTVQNNTAPNSMIRINIEEGVYRPFTSNPVTIFGQGGEIRVVLKHDGHAKSHFQVVSQGNLAPTREFRRSDHRPAVAHQARKTHSDSQDPSRIDRRETQHFVHGLADSGDDPRRIYRIDRNV